MGSRLGSPVIGIGSRPQFNLLVCYSICFSVIEGGEESHDRRRPIEAREEVIGLAICSEATPKRTTLMKMETS